MGARRTTYTDIQTRLIAQAPALQVALYNGQPDALKGEIVEELPFKPPCVFIELAGGPATRNASDVREFPDYIFRLHCLFENYQDDHNASPQQQAALAHLDTLETVLNAIDGWQGATWVDEFKFLQEYQDTARTHLVYHVLEFQGLFQDCTLAEANQGETGLATTSEIIRTGQSEHETIIEGNIRVYDPDDNPYKT